MKLLNYRWHMIINMVYQYFKKEMKPIKGKWIIINKRLLIELLISYYIWLIEIFSLMFIYDLLTLRMKINLPFFIQ